MRLVAPLKGRSILVVEDDAIQAIDLTETLKEAGARVIGPAWNADTAMQLARSNTFSAAVLDYRLCSRNCMSVANELNQRHTPFIILTAYDAWVRLPHSWHGCRLVTKPANMAKLVRTIAALIRWKNAPVSSARQRIRTEAAMIESALR